MDGNEYIIARENVTVAEIVRDAHSFIERELGPWIEHWGYRVADLPQGWEAEALSVLGRRGYKVIYLSPEEDAENWGSWWPVEPESVDLAYVLEALGLREQRD